MRLNLNKTGYYFTVKRKQNKGQQHSFETAEYYKILKAVTITFVIRNNFG